MIVNYQKKLTFKNVCDCIFDAALLEKALLWHSRRPLARLKKIFMHGRYPCVAIYREKIHVHRLLMSYLNRRRLERHEHVNHIDGNRLNSAIANLQILHESAHLSLTNKGRPLSKEHRLKIANAMRLSRYAHPFHQTSDVQGART